MWFRRRSDREPLLSAADGRLVLDRLASLERRMEDLEDLAHASLSPDRLDELDRRLAALMGAAATHDDVLELRLHTARLADELDRVGAAVRAGLGAGDEPVT